MKKSAFVWCALCFFLFSATLSRAQDPAVVAADFDGNGTVEFSDFLIFARGFGKTAGTPEYDARLDLDGSGTVDFPDFIAFARGFGHSTSEPLQTLLYIADLFEGAVSVIDVEANLTQMVIPVSQPRGIAVSQLDRRLFVAGIDTFYALTETGDRLFQIPLVDPPANPEDGAVNRGGFRVALSSNNRFAFITEEFINQVEVIDLNQRQSVARIPVGRSPVGIAVGPDGQVYVATRDSTLSVIDGIGLTLKERIPLHATGSGRLALSRDGTRVYLARHRVVFPPAFPDGKVIAQLIALDPAAKTVVDSVDLGEANNLDDRIVDLALSRDGAFVYATLQRVIPRTTSTGIQTFELSADLVVVDVGSFQQASKLRLGEQVGNLGVSPDRSRAFVSANESIAQGTSLQIMIIDLNTMERIGALRGFTTPTDLKFRSSKPGLQTSDWPELFIF